MVLARFNTIAATALLGALELFGAVTLFSCKKNPETTPDLATAKPSLASLAERGRSGVVLILNYKPDGTTTFGAGLIINDDGGIVTNSHVIDGANAVGVLLFRADRTTYSPLDGGLGRFLFEYQREIVPAAVIRKNESLDLAILRAQASTAKLSRLPFATKPVTVGENVIALGHPQEAAWSITRGVVSALPFGLVQHDALISPGSSGGPLLNEQGEVVGIDTSMVKKAHGAGFARPIAMVRSFIDKEGSGLKIDLSTPARAEETCLRALEIGDLRDECHFNSSGVPDWKIDDLLAELLVPSTNPFIAIVSPVQSIQVLELLAVRQLSDADESLPALKPCAADSSEFFLCRDKVRPILPKAFEFGVATLRKALADASPVDLARAKKKALAHIAEFQTAEKESLVRGRSAGLKVEHITEFRALLRNGYRVENVLQLDEKHAWILVSGRNNDGSPYRVSALRVWSKGSFWGINRQGIVGGFSFEGWTETAATEKMLKTLPTGWPPPLRTVEYWEKATTSAICEAWFEYGLPTPQ